MLSFSHRLLLLGALCVSAIASADEVRWQAYQQCFALRPSYGRVSDDKGIFLPSPLRDGVYWYGRNGRVYRFPFQSRCWRNDGNGGEYCSFSITTARREGKTFRILRHDGQPDAIVERAADGREMFYLVESATIVPTIEANQILQRRLIQELVGIRLDLDSGNLTPADMAERREFVKGCRAVLSDDYSINRLSDELLPRLQP